MDRRCFGDGVDEEEVGATGGELRSLSDEESELELELICLSNNNDEEGELPVETVSASDAISLPFISQGEIRGGAFNITSIGKDVFAIG